MLMDILDSWYVDFISRPNFYLNISMFLLITTTILFGIVYTIISKALRFLESTLFLLIFFFIFTTLATYLYIEGLI